MSTPSTSVVLSVDHSPTVGTRASLRNSGFQGCSRENTQDELRKNCDSRSEEMFFNWWGYVCKDTGNNF